MKNKVLEPSRNFFETVCNGFKSLVILVLILNLTKEILGDSILEIEGIKNIYSFLARGYANPIIHLINFKTKFFYFFLSFFQRILEISIKSQSNMDHVFILWKIGEVLQPIFDLFILTMICWGIGLKVQFREWLLHKPKSTLLTILSWFKSRLNTSTTRKEYDKKISDIDHQNNFRSIESQTLTLITSIGINCFYMFIFMSSFENYVPLFKTCLDILMENWEIIFSAIQYILVLTLIFIQTISWAENFMLHSKIEKQ